MNDNEKNRYLLHNISCFQFFFIILFLNKINFYTTVRNLPIQFEIKLLKKKKT